MEKELAENPKLGTPLGNNVFKIRLAISDKGKGKSGEARIITHVFVLVDNLKVSLISVYDKSEIPNISNKELKTLVKRIIG